MEISLPLEEGSHTRVKGTVVHAKRISSDLSGHSPGMGIEFKEVMDDDRQILRDFVKRISAQDIPEGQKESIIKPSSANNRKTVL